jgi:hypothetical protein
MTCRYGVVGERFKERRLLGKHASSNKVIVMVSCHIYYYYIP